MRGRTAVLFVILVAAVLLASAEVGYIVQHAHASAFIIILGVVALLYPIIRRWVRWFKWRSKMEKTL
jgi:membrane protein YdbS with pleckstrin-like domain